MADPPTDFPLADVEGSLPARFERIVKAHASAPALVLGPRWLTYEEVDRRSDRLAAAIAAIAPAGEAPVAVVVGDPGSAILAILATWKAGRLCAPVNPEHPPAYLGAIVRDAGAGLIVTDRDGRPGVPPGACARELRVDEVDLLERVEAPRPVILPSHLACLQYTSGSTGEPKGVVRSHRSVLHRARCSVLSLGIRPDDRVSALHSPSFAAGLRDVLTALLGGAALLPFDVRQAGPRGLAAWIDRERISVLCAVVTTFRPLLAEPGASAGHESVRVVRLGSEPLYRQDVERFRERFRPDCLLVAGYGASEASGIVEFPMRHDTPLPAARVPAGYPLPGVEILVLDDDGRAVGDGQAGEVAVRSRYLADGYWRQPDLTRATFLADPVDPALRVYRTGDVGRLRADGCLELLGRKDHQVKVRGYRVHPGQIEAALAEHEAIRDVVVTASSDADGDSRLVAYIVTAAPAAPTPDEMRRFLRERLPAYLIPSAFVDLAALPVSANGKVDRAALPPPPPLATRPAGFVAPRNPLEHQLAAIWEDLFDLKPIGAHDDFFDLGGDSLLAAGLAAAVEETCGLTFSPALLLDAPTVGALATALLREDGVFDEPLTALRASGGRAPIFFVHNYHGRGLYTHALSRALDPDRPVYAVHLHGLATRALPVTVEAIAADRLRAVRAVRPHGPYVLGGHCYGGIVALEMACQLAAEGERVDAVVMVDTPAPRRRVRVAHRASETLGRLAGLSPAGRATLFAGLDRFAEGIAAQTRAARERFHRLARSDIRTQAGAVARRVAWAARGIAHALEAGPAHDPHTTADASGESWQVYRRAIRRYVPAAYAGPVALFRAEQFRADRPDLGWSRLLPRVDVSVVPGDHHTCITRHVGALAARLEERLQRSG
jgi:amino acid adenylation domain-containing protein